MARTKITDLDRQLTLDELQLLYGGRTEADLNTEFSGEFDEKYEEKFGEGEGRSGLGDRGRGNSIAGGEGAGESLLGGGSSGPYGTYGEPGGGLYG